MENDSRIEIRIPSELKQMFQLWCDRNGITISERLREAIERDVEDVKRDIREHLEKLLS